MKPYVLVLLLAFLLVSCSPSQAQEKLPVTTDAPVTSIGSADEPDKETEGLTDLYYNYLRSITFIQALVNESAELTDYSDDQMSAFALTALIVERGDYDWEVGYPKESFDEVTLKYFGKKIENFENSMTTVIDSTGYITATGWDYGGGAYFILKSLDKKGSFASAEFYYFHINEMDYIDEPEKWGIGDEEMKDFLLFGESEVLPRIVKFLFRTYEDDEFRLVFISSATIENEYRGEIIPFD